MKLYLLDAPAAPKLTGRQLSLIWGKVARWLEQEKHFRWKRQEEFCSVQLLLLPPLVIFAASGLALALGHALSSPLAR